MATVNFSVPDEVKELFNATFKGRNKSAIIARLMLHAVEEELKRKRRQDAVDRLIALREEVAPVSTVDIERARRSLRS